MFGITSESALSQACILLALAIIWLFMALITKKHRTLTVMIYTGIGVLFELAGVYGLWKSISGFSTSKIGLYIIAAFLFLLFVALMAAIWRKCQKTVSERENRG